MVMAYPQTLRSGTILGFIISATVVSMLIGSFAKANWIAINLNITASPASYWHIFVAVTGLLIPIVIRVGYRRHPIVRRLFNAYLIVLLAQIVSELILTPLFLRGISVIIGSLYSPFRLVQLGQGQSWITQARLSRWLRPYLWGLIVLWAINLGRFIWYRWPILLG